jgi:arylsulfatase A-like enzyme
MQRIELTRVAAAFARNSAFIAIVWSAVVGFATCRVSDVQMRPVVRFVDPAERAQIVADWPDGVMPSMRPDDESLNDTQWPSVQIHDETRLVLAAPKSKLVVLSDSIEVPSSGRVVLNVRIGPRLAASGKVLLRGKWRTGTVWTDLDLPVTEVRTTPSGPRIDIQFDVPPIDDGTKLSLYVKGYSVNWGSRTVFTTRAVDIPSDARLEFANGITEPTQAFGSVTFAVDACVDTHCRTIDTYSPGPSPDHVLPWANRRVDLAQFAGDKVRFVFSTRAEAVGGVYPVGVWANPTVYAPAIRTPDEANIILLSIDTLSAPHLTTYGYSRDTTPFINRKFGRSGTVFGTCVAAATSTSPAHMTMFTGEYPSVHGVTTGLQALPNWMAALPEMIRAAGYETAAVTEDGWLGAQNGFGRGFNVYAENKSHDLTAPSGQVNETFARAKKWLTNNYDKRFFLFLHTFQVHTPYAPPEAYRTLFREPGKSIDALPLNEKLRLEYDQEIRYTDDQLRQLFDVLAGLDLERKTIFILTSDHGEAFGEHGWLEHSAHLHEAVTHVPLLFTGPSIRKGSRVTVPVGHTDLFPTILDLFAAVPPSQGPGRSLVPYLLVDRPVGSASEEVPYYTESWGNLALGIDRQPIAFLAPAFNVRVGTKKLARYPTDRGYTYEFFDLVADPDELAPQTDATTAQVLPLRELVDTYEARCAARRQELATATQAPAPSAQHPFDVGLSPEQERKLRALGYIQ